jgi:hypothetical protein
LAAVCETWNHDVGTAADGPEALALVAVFNPEVIVLDLGLRGGLDSVEVAQRIRAIDGDGVFIVALTGWAPADDRTKALVGSGRGIRQATEPRGAAEDDGRRERPARAAAPILSAGSAGLRAVPSDQLQ